MTPGAIIWFTGLPSSGKTTLARSVREALLLHGVQCVLLDGDEVRAALSPEPGYGENERVHFYRTLARLAGLLAGQGLVVLISATAHRRAFRDLARQQAPRFVEVFVDTPLEVCQARDAKGLYAKGVAVPGVASPYEPPSAPEVHAVGGHSAEAVNACVMALESAPEHVIADTPPRRGHIAR
jgi:adenylylsulfate kinase